MSFFLTLLLSLSLLAAPSDGEPKAKRGTFALVNARIETVTNGVIERGTLIIENDRIIALGADVDIPAGAEVIDCEGMTIYPGMIDSGTQVGLVEVGSLPETRDFSEIGDLTPHVEALTAVNPNSVIIPVTRVAGITTVITEPSGGLLPGVASMINLHGYTPDQMNVSGAGYMVLDFPTTARRGRWDRRSEEDIQKAAEEALDKLNEVWDRAQLYREIVEAYDGGPDAATQPDYVPEMMALLPVLRGEMPLLVKVDAAKDITNAIGWVEERALDNVIFSGVAEGWRVADEIAAAGIPCLVGPVLSIPTRQSDRFDKAYANPGLLHAAGVPIAIRSGESENVRNLPYEAGFAAAYGLGREAALEAVTIAPARIFGVEAEYGSLEVGKKANVVVATGDLFETKTQISHVFIDGYMIPMESRHTRLYDEFLNRQPGLEKHPGVEIAPVTETGNQ